MAILDDALALRDAIGTAVKSNDTMYSEIPPGGIAWAQAESIRTRLGLAFTDSQAIIDALGGVP